MMKSRDKRSRRRNRRPSRSLSIARLLFTRNVLLMLIAALAITLVVAFSLLAMKKRIPFFPMQAIVQPTDFSEIHPVTHPEQFDTYEFTYGCGHAGSFKPADVGTYKALHFPMEYKAELEAAPCHNCWELLEYASQKDRAAADSSSTEAAAAGSGE